MNIEITRMSSRGQVVIPKEMRKGIQDGEKMVIIQNGKQFILEKLKDLDERFIEDLEFARRTEEAWKDIDEGRYEEYAIDEFFSKLKQ